MKSGTSKLEKAEKNFRPSLLDGEKIIWWDNGLSLVTDQRVIYFKISFRADQQYGVTTSVPLPDIDSWEQVRAVTKRGFLLQLRDGSEEFLKVPDPDYFDELSATLKQAIVSCNPLAVVPLITSENRKELQKKTKDEIVQAEAELFGDVSVSESFGTKWVTVYSKGYVKVSSGMGLIKGDVEKLVDIFGETDITKKSGLGRAAGAVFTMGANITLSPNQRGNLYLTITTEKNTHSLMWDRPDASSIKRLNKIVSAGKGAIARGSSPASEVSQTYSSPSDLATQISNLNQLRESGVISDDEFQKAKTKLIEG